MNTHKVFASLPLLVIVLISLIGTNAYADMYSYGGVNYTIPAGYQSYTASPGIFYNAATGTYYNPVTGQVSSSPLIGSSINVGNYSVPQGYVPYNYGTYYNSMTGMYYNPHTGQTSIQAPIGPGARNPNGSFIILPGYSYYAYGTYYNSGASTYWDPETGFFSNSVPGPTTYTYSPVQPVVPVYVQTVPTYTVAQPIVYPVLPSTGAGGESSANMLILTISGLVALGGIIALRRLAYS